MKKFKMTDVEFFKSNILRIKQALGDMECYKHLDNFSISPITKIDLTKDIRRIQSLIDQKPTEAEKEDDTEEFCTIYFTLKMDTVCEENKGYITERIGEVLDQLDRERVIKNGEIK